MDTRTVPRMKAIVFPVEGGKFEVWVPGIAHAFGTFDTKQMAEYHAANLNRDSGAQIGEDTDLSLGLERAHFRAA